MYADPGVRTETIAGRLSVSTCEVERLIRRGVPDANGNLDLFRVGRVLSAEKHPNADRLKLCRVDTGKGVVQVVCGAPNARTGMKGVFAPPVVRLPPATLVNPQRPYPAGAPSIVAPAPVASPCQASPQARPRGPGEQSRTRLGGRRGAHARPLHASGQRGTGPARRPMVVGDGCAERMRDALRDRDRRLRA